MVETGKVALRDERPTGSPALHFVSLGERMRLFVYLLLFLGSLPCLSFAKSTEAIFLDIENKYSNPNISAVVASELRRPPQPGDIGPTGTAYRTLDQISPGSTPYAVQLGARLTF